MGLHAVVQTARGRFRGFAQCFGPPQPRATLSAPMGATAHAFIDGQFLKKMGEGFGVDWPCPSSLAQHIVNKSWIRNWDLNGITNLRRVTFYDGVPDPDGALSAGQQISLPVKKQYWDAIELQPRTHLGFGYAKKGRDHRGLRQKAVDTLIAVDMLSGAFDQIFDLAILVAGDADFVPVVEEVRRRGVCVIVASDSHLSDDLRRSADIVMKVEKAGHRSHHDPINLVPITGM